MSDLQRAAKNAVVVYFNSKNNQHALTEDDVTLTSFTELMANWKATAITGFPDGTYYELTYNDDTNELNVDAYKKFDSMVFSPKAD